MNCKDCKKMRNVVLLLTCTVKPNIANPLFAGSPEIREKQYRNAIKWYLENTNYQIIVAENSGTNLSDGYDIYKTRIEFLTYQDNGKNAEKGKGYKEMKIIDFVSKNSEMLNQGEVIVKITGRLILLNISKIIESLLQEYEKGIKNGFVAAYRNSTRPFSDCRYIFFTPNFIPYLLRKKDTIHDGHNFEMITAECISEAKRDGLRFIYPRYMSRTHGIAGGAGYILDKTDLGFFFESIKHRLRKILFDFGILPLK